MEKHSAYPVVAIVGRPNVGKSALFNRLAGRNIAIVHDRPGVTRDRLTALCKRGASPVEIMDTGGIGETISDEFAAQVQAEAQLGMDVADLILFVVDGFEGMHPVDQTLAHTLRKSPKPLVLVVNKVDSEQRTAHAAEFSALGFEHLIETSAAHGLGIDQLVEKMNRILHLKGRKTVRPTREEIEEPKESPLRLAIVGRPNAGKSSLINAVIGSQRTIVSPVAGTTRDAVDIPFEIRGRRYLLIDTAGMRRKARISDAVETFSSIRAAQTIKRADLNILVVDCAEGAKMQDRKIAEIIVKSEKPCILVLNKFDLYHPGANLNDRLEELEETMRREFFFMPYAPMIAVSALKGQFLEKIFAAVETVRDGSNNQPGTGVLNRLLHRAEERSPATLGRSGKSFHLLYAAFIKEEEPSLIPTPHILIFANRTGRLQDSYLRHLEKVIREEWPADGLPMRFTVRAKERRKRDGDGTEVPAERTPRDREGRSVKRKFEKDRQAEIDTRSEERTEAPKKRVEHSKKKTGPPRKKGTKGRKRLAPTRINRGDRWR